MKSTSVRTSTTLMKDIHTSTNQSITRDRCSHVDDVMTIHTAVETCLHCFALPAHAITKTIVSYHTGLIQCCSYRISQIHSRKVQISKAVEPLMVSDGPIKAVHSATGPGEH